MMQRGKDATSIPTCLIALAMFLCVGSCAVTAFAQTGTLPKTSLPKQPVSQTDDNKTAPETTPSKSTDDKTTKKNDIIYLRAPDGSLVPVPADASLKEYLEWKKKQALKIKTKKPRYSMASVSLAGSVKEEGSYAQLDATLSIQLDVDDEWVQVPLEMNEAILKDSKYTGKGTASFDRFDRTAGYSWWLKGKGTHTLTLSILVPIRKKSPMRRLQLSLPETAVSHLKLTVPISEINVKANEQSLLQVTHPNAKTSVVDLFGLGTRFDLQWQTLSSQKQKKTVLHTTTRMHVVPNTESILLTATQEYRAFQGSFSSVEVQLPTGWELVDLKGDEYVSHAFVKNKSNKNRDIQTVKVELDEKTSGPVELVWTLEAPFPEGMKPLSLQGFQVNQARRQMGSIAIDKLEGYRVVPTRTRSVHRMNVSDIVVNNNRIATAYRFLKQPYQLQLTIQEIDPNYSVEPDYQLQISQNEIELNATYQVSVHRGALKEIQFYWSSRLAEGWTIDSISSTGLISSGLIDKNSDPQIIMVPLLERKNGKFELQLKARRKIKDDKKPISLQLPVLYASEQLPAKLNIKQADNIETQLSAAKTTRLKVIKGANKTTSYQLTHPGDVNELFLLATLQVHQQKIKTTTFEILTPQKSKLLVEQHIVYSVAYEELSQVRLQMPESISKKVKFFLNGETPLTENTTALKVEGGHQIRIPLPTPLLGTFEIVARYSVDLPEGYLSQKQIPILLPLVLSSDAAYQETRLQSKLTPVFQLLLKNDSFEKEVKLNGMTEWISTEQHRSLSIQLIPIAKQDQHHFRITRSRIQSSFEKTGQEKTRAQYLLEGDLKSITFELSSDYLLESCWLNDQKISVEQIKNSQYRLLLSNAVSQESQLLTIDYHSKSPVSSRWIHSYQLAGLKILGGEWTGGVIWDVTVPADQHLFLLPRSFSPLFEWRREGMVWRRRLSANSSLQMAMPGHIKAPAMRSDFLHGNHYLFSRLEEPGTMNMTTMNRSLVVLFGAGLSLVAGFILLKIPATRNLLTLLLVAFTVSVVAVWFWEPVQLLIQPALLGLLLAVSAAIIERMLERNRYGTPLLISTPSDYMIPSGTGSSVMQPSSPPVFGLGSEDPTIVRPAPSSASDSLSSPEVGSHS